MTLCTYTLHTVTERLKHIGANFSAAVIEADFKHGQLGDDIPEERTEHVAGILELANALIRNPDLESPIKDGVSMTFYDFMYSDPKAEMMKYRRAIGGRWDKDASQSYFSLRRDLHGLSFTLSAPRDAVCERVVVGQEMKEVPKYGPPTMVNEMVEIVEWQCPDGLLA